MADQPVKDVFEDEDAPDDDRVIDEAEEAEQQAGTETAVSEIKSDDIEVVLAEEEKAAGDDATTDDDAAADANLAAVPGAEPAAQEGGEEVDEDLKSYSKKVQDRIARERRLVKRTREEAEAAIVMERGQRIEAERRSLTAHKNLTEVLLVNIDNQIKAKSTELKALMTAVATGDEEATGKQVDVQGELDDLRAKKREIEGAKVSLASQAEEFERQVKAPVVMTPTVTPATQAWLGQNKWFNRKGFFAETVAVRQLDNQLAGERRDKGSAEYFKELNRRIQSEIPDLAGKVRQAFKPANQTRSAVAPVSKGGSVKPDVSGKRRVTLDKTDLQTMREFKLDPTNKEHVAAFAREKLANS